MMTKLWMLRMKLNLTMLLRIMLEESLDITLARVMSMFLMFTRMEMIGVDENDNNLNLKMLLRTRLKILMTILVLRTYQP